jgi:farnesyl-diphosphate farnesyltransferase
MCEIQELVESVSRTFALSIHNLPSFLRQPVGLSYLLFRISDCIEDTPELEAERKNELLQLWGNILLNKAQPRSLTSQITQLDTNNPEVRVAQQAERLVDLFHTLDQELRAMISRHCADATFGMARWQRDGPYIQTEEDLDDYMLQVAGMVGYLMTDIFAFFLSSIRKQKAMLLPLSRHVGLGLQTVNVIRGLRTDHERGWMFVPASYLKQAGIDRSQFFLREFEEKSLAIVERLIHKAEMHLNYGLAYIAAFPSIRHRIRLSCIWPLLFAVKTLAISSNNPEVIRSEVKISRQNVKDIIQKTTLFGWSNIWLRHYYYRLCNSLPV